MKRLAASILLLLAVLPSLGQKLYSYKDKNGRLVITDKPVRNEDHKLVDTFVSEEEKARQRAAAEAALRSSRIGSAYTLTKKQIEGLAYPIAKSMGVDPELVYAVIEIESSRDVRAKSHKGAMGLMQLIPETAERFGVKNVWNPRQNILGGVRYLRYLLSYFEGNVDYVLAAYNAGENAVDRHRGIPPYKETKNYIRKIRRLYTKTQLPYGDTAKRRSILVTQAETTRTASIGSAE